MITDVQFISFTVLCIQKRGYLNQHFTPSIPALCVKNVTLHRACYICCRPSFISIGFCHKPGDDIKCQETACSNAILCMQYLTAFMFATYGSRLWQEYNKLVGSNRMPKYGWRIQRSCKQKNEYYVLLICRSSLLRNRKSSKNIRFTFHYIRMTDRENLHHIYWWETYNKQHYFFIMAGHPTCYSVHTVNSFPWAKRPGFKLATLPHLVQELIHLIGYRTRDLTVCSIVL
jgi:hypothetical protein